MNFGNPIIVSKIASFTSINSGICIGDVAVSIDYPTVLFLSGKKKGQLYSSHIGCHFDIYKDDLTDDMKKIIILKKLLGPEKGSY